MINKIRLRSLNNHFQIKHYATSIKDLPFRVEVTRNRHILLHPHKDHKYSLIWLHGLGDSAEGFVDLFLDTKYNLVPDFCKVILLTAPERAVSMN